MYRHRKTGNEYRVDGVILAEHPDTHEWIRSVIYSNSKGKQYVRSLARFLVSFDHIEGTAGKIVELPPQLRASAEKVEGT